MFKNLLDYNSPENVWLRDHKLSFGVTGVAIGMLFLVPTVYKIIQEFRNA